MNWSIKTVNQTELKWFPYWFLSCWIVALGILTSPRIFWFYSPNCPTWSAEQTDINQAGKGVYCILQDSRSFPWGKLLETLLGFFLPLSTENTSIRSLVRSSLYDPRILCSTLIGAAMLLVLLPAVPTKTMVHRVALTLFLPLLVKDPFV